MNGSESPILLGMRAQHKAKQAEAESLLRNPTPSDSAFAKAQQLMDERDALALDIDARAGMEAKEAELRHRLGRQSARDSEIVRTLPFAGGGNPPEQKTSYFATAKGECESEDDKFYRTGGFKTLGHFAWSTYKCGRNNTGEESALMQMKTWEDHQLKMKNWDLQQKAPSGMYEESDPDGGNLIPPEFSNDIYTRMVAQNLILQYLNPITVRGNTLTVPAIKEDSRVDGQRGGGILGFWQGEADQYTVSKTRTRVVDLKLHKLTVYTFATDELVNDSPIALQTWLLSRAPAEINFKINDGIINGDGAGKPKGLLQANSRITVAAVSGQGNNTIVYQNITDMWMRAVAGQRDTAVWLYNQDCESQLIRLFMATGTAAGIALFTPNENNAPGMKLMSRPALVMEQCQSIGTAGDLILFCPKGYVSITKGGVESFMSIHLRFDYDETAYKWRFRFDAQPFDLNPLTPFKGTNTVSSIVVLNSTRT